MPRGPATTLHVGKGPDVETPVDVVTQITVDRPVDAVASYAGDPSNATKAVRQHRIGHVADVATNHGWLKARVTYTWEPAGTGRTRMTFKTTAKPKASPGSQRRPWLPPFDAQT